MDNLLNWVKILIFLIYTALEARACPLELVIVRTSQLLTIHTTNAFRLAKVDHTNIWYLQFCLILNKILENCNIHPEL